MLETYMTIRGIIDHYHAKRIIDSGNLLKKEYKDALHDLTSFPMPKKHFNMYDDHVVFSHEISDYNHSNHKAPTT